MNKRSLPRPKTSTAIGLKSPRITYYLEFLKTQHWVHSNSFYLVKMFLPCRILILADIRFMGYKLSCCDSLGKDLLFKSDLGRCVNFTMIKSHCNYVGIWLKSGKIAANWRRFYSKSFPASIILHISISLLLKIMENIKNLQYKNFMQLWNHKQVVLSKDDFIHHFNSILNQFLCLQSVLYWEENIRA